MLGEAPGEVEDRQGIPFVGNSGQLLKRYLPSSITDRLRWGNVIRCRPPDNRDPREVEIECCRPSVEKDIEATKPVAIFGFGNVPLWWALKQSGITKWCGRRVPIRVGKHACWYYPMMHPSYILHTRKFTPFRRDQYGSEIEFAFAHQLRRAIREVDTLPPPIVHSEDDALCGLDIVTGEGGDGDLDRIRDFFRDIRDEPIVGLDYETDAFRPYNKGTKILSGAFAGPEGALGIALDHRGNRWKPKQRGKAYDLISDFIYSGRGRRRLVSHHLPFELEWSASFFGDECLWDTDWGDTESQAYILDERPYAFSLDFLCVQYFGLSIKSIDNLDRDHLDDFPVETVLRYNALDSKYHRLLYLIQGERLDRTHMDRVYRHQLDRTIAMIPMQLDGLPIDKELNRYLSKLYTGKLQKLEADIAEDSQAIRYRNRMGKPYRPSSLDDVKYYLTRILRKRNLENVDEKTLSKIDDPLISKTRRWRKLNKVLSTYILPVGEGSKHLYTDGKLHPITSTTRTRTWRTSGQDPNTQNWPVRNPIAMKARKQIAAALGCDEVFVAFDFAGIQARNVAMESKDKALIKAFWNHYDIHFDWMERIAKHYPQWIPGGVKALRDKDLVKKMRYRAKNQLVFPSFFGAQPPSISRNLQIPENIAMDLHAEFWDKFPDIKGWHEFTYDNYQRTGYVTGLSGFRRHAPVKRNELINCPIQSDESLIVCNALVRLSKLGFNPRMEIHDDLTFLWPKQKIDEYAEVVIGQMLKVQFDWVNVPLELEMKIGGRDWGSLKEVGKFESVGKDQWREMK
jgi:uracil-DNA glycosylase family 4